MHGPTWAHWALLASCVVATVAITACEAGERKTQTSQYPPDWQVFDTPGGRVTYVVPIRTKDGTRCVIAIGDYNGAGSITCDWSAK